MQPSQRSKAGELHLITHEPRTCQIESWKLFSKVYSHTVTNSVSAVLMFLIFLIHKKKQHTATAKMLTPT